MMDQDEAQRLKKAYRADSPGHYQLLCTMMEFVKTQEELDSISLTYAFDVTYTNADIGAAKRWVERVRGWK